MSAKEFAHTKFVLLTSPRSGSTWLISLLNQMPDTTAFGELFLPRKRRHEWDMSFSHPRFVEVRKRGRFLRPVEVFSYLDDLYRRPGVVGFKLMYAHLRRNPELLVYFWINRIRVVHLVRQNQLDLLISRAVKRKLQRAHRMANEVPLEGIQVELDPQNLLRKLQIKERKVERGRALLRWSGLRYMEIGYEDLQKDENEFRSLCKFLAIEPVDKMPASIFQKVRREGQSQVLKNYADVRRVLENTGYVAYLE